MLQIRRAIDKDFGVSREPVKACGGATYVMGMSSR